MKLVKTLAIFGVLLVIAAMPVMGQLIHDMQYLHIAPTVIPVDTGGSSGVGVIRIDLENTGAALYVQSVVVARLPADTLGTADIESVDLYVTDWAGKDFPVGGTPTGFVDTSFTEDGNNLTITVATTSGDVPIPAGSTKNVVFVVVGYAAGVSTPETVAYEIASITSNTVWDGSGTSDVFTPTLSPGGGPSAINDYIVMFTGSDIVASANEEEGAMEVEILRLELGAASDEAVDKELASVTFAYTGTDTADVGATSVKLYRDNEGAGIVGSFDTGGTDPLVSTGIVWSGTNITLNTSEDIPNNVFSNSPAYFFLLVDIADLGIGGTGHTIGFQVVDEKIDLTFYDEIDDIISGTTAVPGTGGGEFDQIGYITTSAGLSSSLITIDAKTVVDTTPPEVTSTFPVDLFGNVSRDVVIQVNFSEAMATIVPTDVTVVGSTSGAYDLSTDGDFVFATTAFTFDLTGQYDYSETVTVTVDGAVKDTYAADPNFLYEWLTEPDDPLADYSFSFEIEPSTPPEVTNTTPNAGTIGVARDTTVEVVFSEAMDLATLIAANFDMTDELAATIPGTFAVVGDRTITFVPDALLDFDTTYTVELVSANIFDAEGTSLADWLAATHPYSFQFKTVANIPPTVLATIPADGSIDANIGTSISVVFSKAMDEATVLDDANFSLTETGATDEVAGVLTYTPEANTITFTPDESLTFSTTYTATATTGVTDAEGSALAADYTFTFMTASAAASLSFTDIIVANNRIVPGSTDPMRIFIETPEGLDAGDAVTIQVYTSTGRRVATLTTAGETYADAIARQPILWDGTNDREQPLGPGLYFVQVSSAGYRRALRVMIVR